MLWKKNEDEAMVNWKNVHVLDDDDIIDDLFASSSHPGTKKCDLLDEGFEALYAKLPGNLWNGKRLPTWF